MSKGSKGQLSTFLKPIILVGIAVIFALMISFVFLFPKEVEITREKAELETQVNRIKDNILHCLAVEENVSTSEILINRSMLWDWNRLHRYEEPACAEDFDYGWNATVQQIFTIGKGASIAKNVSSIMLVLDTSGSMSERLPKQGITKFDAMKEAASEFPKAAEEGDLIGIVRFPTPYSIAGAVLVQPLTRDKELVIKKIKLMEFPNGGTPMHAGIQIATDELAVRGEGSLNMIILTDGCPNVGKDKYYPYKAYEAAKNAARKGIKIYTIGFGLGHLTGAAGTCTREQAIKTISKIANIGGGKIFLAETIEDLREVYSQISKDIVREKVTFYGAKGTCAPDPRVGYGGELDIAFTVDHSVSMVPYLPYVCPAIDKIIKTLKSMGIDVKYKVYQQPVDPEAPVDVSFFTVRCGRARMRCPEVKCADEDSVWPEAFGYNPFKDSTLEGWGPNSYHIMHNFTWRDTSDIKAIVVIGDHDPTGGCDGKVFERESFKLSSNNSNFSRIARLDENCRDYHGGDIEKWNPWRKMVDSRPDYPSEVEIMANISTEANMRGINFYFLQAGPEYMLEEQYEYGSDDANDAIEAMDNVSKETFGKRYRFFDWPEFLEDLKRKFLRQVKVADIGVCPSITYKFGEFNGSFEPSLGERAGINRLTFNFPVTIWQNEKIKTQGNMSLEVRTGPLESLVGAIDRVYKLGKETKSQHEEIINLNTENKLFIKEMKVEIPKIVEYTISGGESPEDFIVVDEDLTIGVNAEPVFEDRDSLPTYDANATYRGEPIKFEGVIGDSLQIWAYNYNPPTLELGKLYLHCCNGKKVKITDGLFFDERMNKTRYEELHKGYIIYHNYTTLNIGEYSEVKFKALCTISGNEESCVKLKPQAVNNINLDPGIYRLKIKSLYPKDAVEVVAQ